MQLADLLSGPTWQHLLLALAHSLWQGAVVAAVLRLALGRLAVRRANLRDGVSLVALATVVIGCLVTWAVLDLRSHVAAAGEADLAMAHDTTGPRQSRAEVVKTRPGDPRLGRLVNDRLTASDERISSPAAAIHDRHHLWYAAATLVWLAGAATMLARTAWLVTGAKRLAHGATVKDARLSLLVDALRERLRLRRAVRLIDGGAFGPAVLGIVRPAMLLPAAILADMPVASVEAILRMSLRTFAGMIIW